MREYATVRGRQEGVKGDLQARVNLGVPLSALSSRLSLCLLLELMLIRLREGRDFVKGSRRFPMRRQVESNRRNSRLYKKINSEGECGEIWGYGSGKSPTSRILGPDAHADQIYFQNPRSYGTHQRSKIGQWWHGPFQGPVLKKSHKHHGYPFIS
jgi:hypothetical protein